MQQAKKFLFESDFDNGGPDGAGGPVPSFTKDDLAAARQQGVEEGKILGRQDAEAAIENLSANALVAIGKSLATLDAAQSQASKSNARDAAELAMAVTRKVLPEISKRGALTEIEAMVCKCLADRFDEPRVVIRTHDSLLDSLRTRIEAAAANAGFTGKFALLAEEGLKVTDCRVEWADGGAERDEARLWKEIEETAQRFLHQLDQQTPADATAPAQTPAPAMPENKDQDVALENETEEKVQADESPGENHER